MKKISNLVIGDGGTTDDISTMVLSMDVSLSMGMVSQLTFNVADPGLRMMRANYFQFRQKVSYLGVRWEVAAIEVRQGAACEEVRLTCRLAAIQRLKRDKGAQVFPERTPTEFVSARASELGLEFFGESTPAKGNISRVRNDRTDESTWDVMQRLAGDNQFLLFETDGRLFFCSQQFLLGKFALASTSGDTGFLATRVTWSTNGRALAPEDPAPSVEQKSPQINSPTQRPTLRQGSRGEHVTYLQTVLKERGGQNIAIDGSFGPQTRGAVLNLQRFFGLEPNGIVGTQTWATVDFLASGVVVNEPSVSSTYTLVPIGVPSLRRSDDSAIAVTGSFKVEREYGRSLRPGMTVLIDGVPGFNVYMLITDVNWREGTEDAVDVSLATPQEPEDGDGTLLSGVDLTGGGFGSQNAGLVFL